MYYITSTYYNTVHPCDVMMSMCGWMWCVCVVGCGVYVVYMCVCVLALQLAAAADAAYEQGQYQEQYGGQEEEEQELKAERQQQHWNGAGNEHFRMLLPVCCLLLSRLCPLLPSLDAGPTFLAQGASPSAAATVELGTVHMTADPSPTAPACRCCPITPIR